MLKVGWSIASRLRPRPSGYSLTGMKKVAISKFKDELSKYLRLAEREEVVITRHGKPAGVLRAFSTEDEWFDYRLEHDPRFLRRIELARRSLRERKGVRLEDMDS